MSNIDRHKRREPPTPPPPLLTLRLLVLGTTSVIVGLVITALAWRATGGTAASALAGISSSGLAFDRLHRWTGT